MLKSFFRGTLRRFGYRLCRIRSDDFRPNPRIDYQDWQASLAVIERVTKSRNGSMTWERSRQYLDSRRLNFYYGVLEVIDTTNVVKDGASVLDVGVYFGYLLRILHRFHPAARYYGTDTHETRLAIAKELCPFANIEYGTIDELDRRRTYNLVLLTEVLEHLVDPADALHKLARLTDSLLLTVPNGRHDATEAMQFHPEWGSYRGHVNFWSPESWQHWLASELPNYPACAEV